MLSPADNELMCRVGPGTSMGNLMREFWQPALISSELPEPDGEPLRLRLLGEDLIAFRDSSGRVGVVANACPHRGASMFFGRNEENGLRCVYHGWKFDTAGNCTDMPNEPAESNFRHKIRITTYPAYEVAGAIYIYMGSRPTPPPVPQFEWMAAPAEQTNHRKTIRWCNWVQALEGDMDGSHTSFLHAYLRRQDDFKPLRNGYRYQDKSPRLEVVTTDAGLMYGYRRNAGEYTDGENNEYTRITQFLLPFYSMVATTTPVVGGKGEPERTTVGVTVWQPMDDSTTVVWSMAASLTAGQKPRAGEDDSGSYLPHTTAPDGRWRPITHRGNDYLMDRQVQKTLRFTGIPGGNGPEDQAVTETMGPIYTRQGEHLATSDSAIIQVRRRLLGAVKAHLDRGALPRGIDHPEVYRIRSSSTLLPAGANWVDASTVSRMIPADRPAVQPVR